MRCEDLRCHRQEEGSELVVLQLQHKMHVTSICWKDGDVQVEILDVHRGQKAAQMKGGNEVT